MNHARLLSMLLSATFAAPSASAAADGNPRLGAFLPMQGTAGDASGYTPVPASTGRMKRFPAGLFRSGFYVDADTRCEDASNATTYLIGRAWFSGSIDRIEQKGEKVFEVQATGYFQGQEDRFHEIVRFDAPTRISLRHPQDSEYVRQKRYCPQPQMPGFRDNDIRGIDED